MPDDSYRTGTDENGHQYIECSTCGRRSYNVNDIEHRYCGYCHIFHEKGEPMIVIPLDNGKERHIVVIIEKDNLERIEKHDPITLDTVAKGGLFMTGHPLHTSLMIAYEDGEGVRTVKDLAEKKDTTGILKFLTRGFTFDPAKDGNEHITGHQFGEKIP